MSPRGRLFTLVVVLAAAMVTVPATAADTAPDDGVTVRDLCDICQCGHSSGGRGRCPDLHGRTLIVGRSSEMDGVQHLELANATAITFNKAALSVGRSLEVSLTNCSRVTFSTGSLRLSRPTAELTLSIDGASFLQFEADTLTTEQTSSHGGDFHLSVQNSDQVSVLGRAFATFKEVTFDTVSSFRLSSEAFKPRQVRPDAVLKLRNIDSVPVLPSNAFSSSELVSLERCKVGEVASSAFSANQFTQIVFRNATFDRISRESFPDRTLVGSLLFDGCALASVSEGAFQSGISSLTLKNTNLESISREGFRCQAAKVTITGCLFKTVKNRSLSIQSWDEFSLVNNNFRFVDSEAFLGISSPIHGQSVSFTFSNNTIAGANRDALRLNLSSDISVTLRGNHFERECSCDIDQRLRMVCGGSNDRFCSAIFNSSSCALKSKSDKECFEGVSDSISISQFHRQMCSEINPEDGDYSCSGKISKLERIFFAIDERVEINSNKGILTVIFVVAVFLSLIVSICTLIRWIIFVIQVRFFTARGEKKDDQEWNFTKIEERHHALRSPSLLDQDHYESLPLTKEEELEEDDVISAQTTLNSDRKSGEKSPNAQIDPEVCSSVKDSHETDSVNEDSSRRNAEAKDQNVGARPKMTFYDEMIDLLKEKLDDPDNYGTVADSKGTAVVYYEDPVDLKKAL